MKMMQASMKDSAAKKAVVPLKHCYRVGSRFKGCRSCGTTEWIATKGGKPKEVWLDGFNVYRSYDPKWKGWTWWCYDCGATDFKCWDATDYGIVELGQPPVQGARDAKALAKKRRLESGVAVIPAAKAMEIVSLELELKQLLELKGKK